MILFFKVFLYKKPTYLDFSKLKGFADGKFDFDENVLKWSVRVENTVGKGEIVPCEQFFFSHSVFKGLLLQICNNKGLHGKGLKSSLFMGTTWFTR